jgi:hypothetical protein
MISSIYNKPEDLKNWHQVDYTDTPGWKREDGMARHHWWMDQRKWLVKTMLNDCWQDSSKQKLFFRTEKHKFLFLLRATS